MLASRTAGKAVELLYNDESSKAIGISGNQIVAYDLEDALNMERTVDQDMYALAEVLAK